MCNAAARIIIELTEKLLHFVHPSSAAIFMDYRLNFWIKCIIIIILIDIVIQMGQSPLYVACGNKQTAAVRLLLEYGADVNLSVKVRIKVMITLNFEQCFYAGSKWQYGSLLCMCVWVC